MLARPGVIEPSLLPETSLPAYLSQSSRLLSLDRRLGNLCPNLRFEQPDWISSNNNPNLLLSQKQR